MLDAARGPGTSNAPSVDKSHFPLVIIRFARESMTDSEIEAFIETLTGFLRRKEPHLVILDGLDVEFGLTARQRKRFTGFVQDPEMRDLSRHKLADILLLKSPMLRGMLTAVFWLAQPVSPTKAFADIDEATPFIEERLRANGIALTDSMRTHLMRSRRR